MARVRNAQEDAAVLLRLNDRLRDLSDTADLSYAAAELLGEALGAARVGYGVFDPDLGTIHVERDWSAAGLSSTAGVHRFSDKGSHFEDLRRGQAVTNEDVETDPRTAASPAALLGLGVRAFLDVPLVEDDRTVAEMFVHSATPRSWLEEEVAFVRNVAERTRAAIARRLAEANLRESEARYRTLFENIDAAFCVVEVIFDEEGRPVDHRFLETNPAFERQSGLQNALGRTAREIFPEHETHWFESAFLNGSMPLSSQSAT